MQRSDFKKTKVELGNGKAYLIHPHTKETGPSAYCPAGCGLVHVGSNGQCLACGTKIVRQRTFKSVAKRFEIIIETNRAVFENMTESQKENLKFPVKLGQQPHYYFVPVRYFLEFDDMMNHDRYESFFTNLEKVCLTCKL